MAIQWHMNLYMQDARMPFKMCKWVTTSTHLLSLRAFPWSSKSHAHSFLRLPIFPLTWSHMKGLLVCLLPMVRKEEWRGPAGVQPFACPETLDQTTWNLGLCRCCFQEKWKLVVCVGGHDMWPEQFHHLQNRLTRDLTCPPHHPLWEVFIGDETKPCVQLMASH